jgi:selenocysteine lyase/cysteine desulfurase
MQIDTLGACGHKWLCGPTGAGLMYIRRQWQDRVRPAILGASSVVDFLNYGHYDFTLRPDAGRYEPGTPNIPGLIGMGAAIDLLTGVGIDAIEARVKSLGDRFIAGLAGRGYQIISPRGGTSWSGMVNFVSANHDHGQIVKSLRKDHRIEIVEREKRLRASPHFYNTEQQVDELVNALP